MPALLPLILTALPSVIEAIEAIFAGIKGAGSVKKTAVQGIVGSVVDTIAALPGNSATAKQKDAILALSSVTVDGIVAAFNAGVSLTGKGKALTVEIAADQGGAH